MQASRANPAYTALNWLALLPKVPDGANDEPPHSPLATHTKYAPMFKRVKLLFLVKVLAQPADTPATGAR
jgi:hypothetical protein